MTLVLGIETSCDETAAAVVVDGYDVRSNVIASQHDLHARYGGVVPEIASRAHLERIGPTIEEALRIARTVYARIDAVAVGNRPGLIGSLLVGTSAAKAIAWSTGKPLIGIDHVRAHLYAATMCPRSASGGVFGEDLSCQSQAGGASGSYPAIGLVVSGGHTSLYDLRSPTEMQLLGRTIDDAVGEAFDKAAVILDLGYPGGPQIDRAAQRGDPTCTRLPRSLLGDTSLDFSFSGLKTALLYRVRGQPHGRGARAHFKRGAGDLSDQQRCDLAASFQEAAVEVLLIKLQRAIDVQVRSGRVPRALLIGGGVAANSLLRNRAAQLAQRCGVPVRLPPTGLCLDNAAMIAGLACVYAKKGRFDDLHLPALARTR